MQFRNSLTKCLHKATLSCLKWFGKYKYGRRPLGVMPLISRYTKGKVFDAGCGTGVHLTFSEDTLGIDIDMEKLRKLQVKGFQVKYLDLEEFPYPFRNGEFDTVICSHVIEHLKQPSETLKEFHRILVENGYLILGFPNPKCCYHDFYDLTIHPYHINKWSLEEGKRFIEQHNFMIDNIYITPPLFGNVAWTKLFNHLPRVKNFWGDFFFVCKKLS